MTQVWANNATSRLDAGISNVDVALVVLAGDGALFPTLGGSDDFVVTLDDGAGAREIISVGSRVGDTFSGLTRGLESTTALAWPAGTVVELRVTAAALTRYEAAAASAAAAIAAIQGWAPHAYSLGMPQNGVPTTGLTLAANGGSVAFPIWIPSKMKADSITVRTLDTTLARSLEVRLYQQVNNVPVTDNTLTAITGSDGSISYTASAAANRTMTFSGSPLTLQPGLYWCVVRNTHATNTLSIGTIAAGTLSGDHGQTKTLGSALGSTLDFVAATWTRITGLVGARITGIVFGEASAF
jgi:hypothetical protein